MERTEKLMMKTIVGYREDRDLENAIDFIQKKVGTDRSGDRQEVSNHSFLSSVPVLWSGELQGLVQEHLLSVF